MEFDANLSINLNKLSLHSIIIQIDKNRHFRIIHMHISQPKFLVSDDKEYYLDYAAHRVSWQYVKCYYTLVIRI